MQFRSEAHYDEYMDMKAEAAYERRRTSYRYHCRDRMCGASDCGNCRNGAPPWEEEEEEEGDRRCTLQRTTTQVARKTHASPYGEIRKGDLYIRVVAAGYEVDGPRWMEVTKRRLKKGPLWPVEASEQGNDLPF